MHKKKTLVNYRTGIFYVPASTLPDIVGAFSPEKKTKRQKSMLSMSYRTAK
jgi:hypothetical protein